ncbi:MAG TPA: pantetheine-phosphate adenylyltransferase [Nitrospirales bacterium]|jgi:pantetheine-phosphate adenylyltransferase|uniref:Phosphopantetheine adenylyltransferase n=1 Tax=Candidatus Nitrospira neomarina TaxID=3020899 RepID=A0AA96GIZ8_9BACT|nr:pantetheine-phosphate adenylyltransferase [Candidatus Nitrospira neomarina]WNM63309.1 pantetheine-phosphate adenylyltransferase [Candidatus Nitrospira neomarina]HSF11160.1 pantetheine-phosphate adenylyltransferase [Nitrospirales bacterium]
MTIGIYPGTFDPITRGHTDVIARSLRLVEQVIVAVAPNPRKAPLFDLDERVQLAKIATSDLKGVTVEPFDGLLVNYVRKRGALAIIRGLRAVSDFEHEFQMALLNRKLDSSLETVFLMSSEEFSYLTSSMVKEVASVGGPLHHFLHPEVAEWLQGRLRRNAK